MKSNINFCATPCTTRKQRVQSRDELVYPRMDNYVNGVSGVKQKFLQKWPLKKKIIMIVIQDDLGDTWRYPCSYIMKPKEGQ